MRSLPSTKVRKISLVKLWFKKKNVTQFVFLHSFIKNILTKMPLKKRGPEDRMCLGLPTTTAYYLLLQRPTYHVGKLRSSLNWAHLQPEVVSALLPENSPASQPGWRWVVGLLLVCFLCLKSAERRWTSPVLPHGPPIHWNVSVKKN